jgi:hypothetical protein
MKNNEILNKIDLFRRSIAHIINTLKQIEQQKQSQSQKMVDTVTDISHVHIMFRFDSDGIMNRQGFIDLPVTSLFCEASEIIENLWIRAEAAMDDEIKGNNSDYISMWLNDAITRLTAICEGINNYVVSERNNITTKLNGNNGLGKSDKVKKRRKISSNRNKTPQQVLKEARERLLAQILARKPETTCREAAKELGCHHTTVTRLKAWGKQGVLAYEPDKGTVEHQKDGSTRFGGIVE